MDRVAHDIDQAVDVLRRAKAHGHMKDFLGEFHRALHFGAAPGDHDAGGYQFLESTAPQLVTNQAEQFLEPGLDNFRQCLSRQPARWPFTNAGHFDSFIGVG